MRDRSRRFIPILLLGIWVWSSSRAAADYVTLVENGPSSNRVDMVFLGDGYTASQIDTVYVDHVQNVLDHMFAGTEDPFPRYANFFNVHRVNVVSEESGADVPPESIFRDTVLEARYYADNVTERLLGINQSIATSILSSMFHDTEISPEIRLVTVNDTRYGGGGNAAYAIFAGGNSSAGELVLHELGHSLMGMADEYYGGTATYTGGEPTEVNVTTSAGGEKWARWLGYTDPDHPEIGTIGAYEGADGYAHGLYRPTENSKMRSLGRPFDAVAREQIILDLYELVDPLDDWLDNSSQLLDPSSLWVDAIDPDVIQVEWLVDGELVDGATGQSFDPLSLGPGSFTVTAHAFDDTPWVRLDTDALEQTVGWSVLVTVPEPGTWILLASGLGLVFLTRRGRRR